MMGWTKKDSANCELMYRSWIFIHQIWCMGWCKESLYCKAASWVSALQSIAVYFRTWMFARYKLSMLVCSSVTDLHCRSAPTEGSWLHRNECSPRKGVDLPRKGVACREKGALLACHIYQIRSMQWKQMRFTFHWILEDTNNLTCCHCKCCQNSVRWNQST